MKKLIILMAAVMMAICVDAQVVVSRTKVKSKSQTTWYGRIGLSIDNLTGGDAIFNEEEYQEGGDGEKNSIGSKVGMDLNFGFMKNIGKSGLYWGMELGIGTRGATLKQEGYYSDYDYVDGQWEEYTEKYTSKGSVMTWNIKYTPFMLGYKYSLTNDLKLDGHLGIYASYDFAGGTKYTWGDGDSEKLSFSELKDLGCDYLPIDMGMQIGVGAWWKKFNFDITYQRGFVPAAKIENYYHGSSHLIYSSNLMLRVGYAF